MSSAGLRVEREGHVETWTLDLPERRNPISSPEVVDAFVDHLGRIGRDPGVRCVVLTGAGPAFSAGGDVTAIRERRGMFGGGPAELRDGYRHGIQRIPEALVDCEVPFVAAVNGPAVGAGCDLALMCDLRVASQDAFFAESFVKLGMIPGDGGAWLLTQAVGPARAAEMTLTGDRVDAATALDWGLVSRVVPADELLPLAHDLAARVAVNPPHAVRMAKRLLRTAQSSDLRGVLQLSAALQAAAHHTEDHREALDALAERRDGDFRGR